MLLGLFVGSWITAVIAVALAVTFRRQLREAEDESTLREFSARAPGRNLANAVYERFGADVTLELEERAKNAPWSGRTRCYSNGRYVGEAWSDGWRLASKEERAEHEALNEDPSRFTVRL